MGVFDSVVADGFARAAAWARLTAQQPSCRQAGGWRPAATGVGGYTIPSIPEAILCTWIMHA